MKLWQSKNNLDEQVERFTIGKDRELDLQIAAYDVLGSIAHVIMLEKIGLLSTNESKQLKNGLRAIYETIQSGVFRIDEGIEDIHSQVEHLLTRDFGDSGKKLHMARSRNDQVLLDLRLFFRDVIGELNYELTRLIDTFLQQADHHESILMPGYTHMQVAMPSSFGLWYGGYAESFIDDLVLLEVTFDLINLNPLGSAAGYGSSFPIDRKETTRLLGFDDLCINSIYAQLGRGKVEWYFANAISGMAMTLNKFAMDVILFSNQNFNFLEIPESFTTGSSIMPHKKNPDVFELMRAKCGKIMSLPGQIQLILHNLPSGYHRDFQILKELVFPSIQEMMDCIRMMQLCVPQIRPKQDILTDNRYDQVFTVEEVNQLVLDGIPFRDAYHHVSEKVRSGNFVPNKNIEHSHIGSIGNPGTDLIRNKLSSIGISQKMNKVKSALAALIDA